MAQRGLNLYEKLQLTKHQNFVGVLEIRALQNAKYWYDYSGTAAEAGLTETQLSQLKSYATTIHQNGFVEDNVSFARTWLSIYNGAVNIPETTPGTEDWNLKEYEGLDNLTIWFVTSDQISVGVDDAFKIHAYR